MMPTGDARMSRSLTLTWQDPMPLAQAARSMSGLEFLRAVRDGKLSPAPIQELVGMKLAEVEEGHAVWELVPDEGARALDPVLVPCDDLGAPGDVDVPEDLPERFG